MAAQKENSEIITAKVENVGGIESRSENLKRGVNILSGANATNRTSFLEALATGFGGDLSTVRTGCDEGIIGISYQGKDYSRTVKPNGVVTGDSFLDDTEEVELFAWIFSDNRIREAVSQGGDLRELVMEPVDTDEIDSEELRLSTRKRQIDSEIEEIEAKKDRLPVLEEEIVKLEQKEDSIKQELETISEDIDEAEQDVETAKEAAEEADSLVKELRSLKDRRNKKKRALDAVEARLEGARTDLEDAEGELDSVRGEIEGFGTTVSELGSEVSSLQSEQDDLLSKKAAFREVIQFNEEKLEQVDDIEGGRQGGELTDQLNPEESTAEVECWTCGSTVARETIENQIGLLKQQSKKVSSESNQVGDEIDEVLSKQRELEKLEEREQTLEGKINQAETEIDGSEQEVQEIKEAIEDLEIEISEVDDELDTVQDQSDHEELINLNREQGRKESDLEDTQREIENKNQAIEDLEKEISKIGELTSERERVAEDLVSVRNRIEEIESDVVETFNSTMEELILLLEYNNISRVYIETRTEGRGDTIFNLKIAREGSDGTVFNDSVENLSESEREVVAIAFALSGYLVHNVSEKFPGIMFDSVEMIDAQRLNKLFEYLEDYTDFIVAALLEEDAQVVMGEEREFIDFGQSALV